MIIFMNDILAIHSLRNWNTSGIDSQFKEQGIKFCGAVYGRYSPYYLHQGVATPVLIQRRDEHIFSFRSPHIIYGADFIEYLFSRHSNVCPIVDFYI